MWNLTDNVVRMSSLEYDKTEFSDLFTQSMHGKEKGTPSKSKSKPQSSSTKNIVQVIDAKRSMNGAIVLKRLKMEYADIAEIVNNL